MAVSSSLGEAEVAADAGPSRGLARLGGLGRLRPAPGDAAGIGERQVGGERGGQGDRLGRSRRREEDEEAGTEQHDHEAPVAAIEPSGSGPTPPVIDRHEQPRATRQARARWRRSRGNRRRPPVPPPQSAARPRRRARTAGPAWPARRRQWIDLHPGEQPGERDLDRAQLADVGGAEDLQDEGGEDAEHRDREQDLHPLPGLVAGQVGERPCRPRSRRTRGRR